MGPEERAIAAKNMIKDLAKMSFCVICSIVIQGIFELFVGEFEDGALTYGIFSICQDITASNNAQSTKEPFLSKWFKCRDPPPAWHTDPPNLDNEILWIDFFCLLGALFLVKRKIESWRSQLPQPGHGRKGAQVLYTARVADHVDRAEEDAADDYEDIPNEIEDVADEHENIE